MWDKRKKQSGYAARHARCGRIILGKTWKRRCIEREHVQQGEGRVMGETTQGRSMEDKDSSGNLMP